jgi:hypothetical protein
MTPNLNNKLLAVIYLCISAALILFSAWSYQQSKQDGDLPGGDNSAIDAELYKVADEINLTTPIPSGSGLIMGAQYNAEKNTFTFDLRANPVLFTEVPEELFFIASGDALRCAKQTSLLIEMIRDTNVAYRLFNREGRVQERIVIEKGSCTTLPVITPKPKQPAQI